MALTLDGSVPMPALGGAASGLGSGVGLGAVGGGVAGLILGSMFAGGGFGGWGGNRGGATGTAVATDIVLNPAFQAIQGQISGLGDRMSDNAIIQQLTAVNQNVEGTSRDTLNSIANLATAQATGNFTTLQSVNDLGRDVTAQNNQNALQQLNSFNNLTTTTLQGFNGAAMQLQNATNQIIAQGTANAAAMAACCCEIKSLISSDGNATRALINQLDKENLQAQLADAKNQATNLAQSIAFQNSLGAQTNVILQHLVPRVETV